MATIISTTAINGIDVLEIDVNPKISGGTAADKRSLAVSQDACTWNKTGDADAAWALVSGPGNEVIGDIYTDDFHRGSLGGNYTLTTTDATASIVSNVLQFNKSSAGSFESNYLVYNPFTSMLNNWYASVTYKVKALNSNSNGIAVGVKGVDGTLYRDIFGYFNTKTTSTNYKKEGIFQYDSGTSNNKKYSSGTRTVAVNDIVTLNVSMVNLILTVEVINNTNPWASFVDTYTFGLASPNLIQTPFQFCIWNNGGDYDISYFKVGSLDSKGVMYVFSGDSTAQGVGASSYSNSQQNLFSQTLVEPHKLTNHALGSAISDNIVASSSSLDLIDPKYHVILIGSNDIVRNIGGDGLQNAKDNLTTIIGNDVSAGRIPIICTPLARNSNSMASFASWVVSTWGSTYTVIDLFSFTKDGATTNLKPAWTNDGTHLNDTGQIALNGEITSNLPEL